MGRVVEKSWSGTIGELVDALSKFPRDMRLRIDGDEVVVAYRVEPERHEPTPDRRGYIRLISPEFD